MAINSIFRLILWFVLLYSIIQQGKISFCPTFKIFQYNFLLDISEMKIFLIITLQRYFYTQDLVGTLSCFNIIKIFTLHFSAGNKITASEKKTRWQQVKREKERKIEIYSFKALWKLNTPACVTIKTLLLVLLASLVFVNRFYFSQINQSIST